MAPVDVFVDFSRAHPAEVESAIARLDTPELLGGIDARVTCAVPASYVPRTDSDWRVDSEAPVDLCNGAIMDAADAERGLLILLGNIEPGPDAIGLLLDAIESDPMIGFARPRLAGASAAGIARLDDAGDAAIQELPRRVLAEVSPTYLVADAPGRCLLVKPVVVANFGELDARFHSLAGALWHYVGRARRCGYRTLVCNRAVMDARGPTGQSAAPCSVTWRRLPAADRELLRDLLPDVDRVREEFGTDQITSNETRLARAMPQFYASRPSLLLDARNIVAGMNGTTLAALGICEGLREVDIDWDVTVLASRQASTFHGLEQRFPAWQIATTVPPRQFTAAVRLSQPWHIQEMIDLHGAAAYNCYLFLDTISWDSAYPAPAHLDGTWQFMADHADALMFDSEYTRARFNRRFVSVREVPSLVPYFSFHPNDYIHPPVTPGPEDDGFIFVVGNHYDHKDVGPTLELLTTAFPYQSIVALATGQSPSPHVTILESGTLSEQEIHRLYAHARVVVFPSFYEGFGFPIVTTLAYGGTVVTRRSPLLDEIAARCLPQGRIVPFVRRDDLVDIIGRLLRGRHVDALPMGTALEDGRAMSWRDVARAIFDFVTNLTGDMSRSAWRSREHAIRQLMAAPVSLADKGLTRR